MATAKAKKPTKKAHKQPGGPTATLKQWREKSQAALLDKGAGSVFQDYRKWRSVNVTEAMKVAYCEALARTGRYGDAAFSIGCVPETMQRHRKNDPVFDEACEVAMRRYADSVIARVQDMAFNGVVTEIKKLYSDQGDDEGEIIKKAFLPALVQMEARRVEPAYRDKQEVSVTQQTTHVLVVPEQSRGPDDWEAFALEQTIAKPDEQQ